MNSPPFHLRSLDRRDALLALEIARFVSRDLGVDWSGASLLIALSGGADSTALLFLLSALRDSLGLSLMAAHMDHRLRPESGDDAAACEALCLGLGVPFRMERADVAEIAAREGVGLEEAGRKTRYAFLDRVRRDAGADWILTAHHADDLAEDVLLRLTRGTAWPGLGGMKALDEERRLLRPLLMVEKRRLTVMLERQAVPWREDASNARRAFRRNRIRHDILPLFLRENPAFVEMDKDLWRVARLDEVYWDERTTDLPVSVPGGLLLPESELRNLPKAGRLRAYMTAIRRLQRGQALSATLFALDDAWEQRRRGKLFYFPGGLVSAVTPDGVLFTAEGKGNGKEEKKAE